MDGRQQHPELREFASKVLPPARRVRHSGSPFRRQHPWEPPPSLLIGKTSMETSGSLAAKASMPIRTISLSTIFGNSIRQRTNGRGWAETARVGSPLQALGYTAPSALLLLPTSPDAGRLVSVGQTRDGNFWLWGGLGLDATSTVGYLNDLWVYQPSSTSPPVPSFTVTGSPVSVAPGATTGNTSTITVTPTGGFTGSVVDISPPARAVPCCLLPSASTRPALSTLPATHRVLALSQSSRPQTPHQPAPRPITSPAEFLGMPGAERLWPAYFSSSFRSVIAPGDRSSAWCGCMALLGGVVACSRGGGSGVACPSVSNPARLLERTSSP